MDDGLEEVRELVRREHRGELAGRALIERCTAAALTLQRSRADVEELLWHYLSDADIRVKDPRYRAQQLPAVMKLLGID